jgi:hypothetical protein
MNSTTQTFGYSKSISILLVIIAIFFVFLPISLPYISSDHGVPSTSFYLGSWIFSAVELLVAIYCGFYKIELTAAHLNYGIYLMKKIYFSDIERARYRASPQINTIDIFTGHGKKVSFTSSIGRFNEFWAELQSRLALLGIRCE